MYPKPCAITNEPKALNSLYERISCFVNLQAVEITYRWYKLLTLYVYGAGVQQKLVRNVDRSR